MNNKKQRKRCTFPYNFQNEFANYSKMGESYKDSPKDGLKRGLKFFIQLWEKEKVL